MCDSVRSVMHFTFKKRNEAHYFWPTWGYLIISACTLESTYATYFPKIGQSWRRIDF